MVYSKFEVLPEMMRQFNISMYDYGCPQIAVIPGAGVDNEPLQVLNDVEVLFGNPVFITP